MAFSKFLYNLIGWKNKSESLTTPLGALNLNKMDSAIKTIGDNLNAAYDEMSTGKLDMSTAYTMVKDVTYDDGSGVFTVTKLDGTTLTIDTKLEKLVTNWAYDKDSQKLILTLDDGTTQKVDLSALITQYEFIDSDTIAFTIESNGTVTANIKDGSITDKKIQPNYLADIKTQASNAETSAQNASEYSDNASYDAKLAQSYAIGGSGIREGEDADNAKYYMEQAKDFSEGSASNISYDNTISGAESTNVQEALDEIQKEYLRQDALMDSLAGNSKEAQYNMLNDMNDVSSYDMTDDDWVVGTYVSPTNTNGALYKRSAVNVWNYIKSKIESVLGIKGIANNLVTSDTSYALGAPQGVALNGRLTSVENKVIDSGWIEHSFKFKYRKKNGFVTVIFNGVAIPSPSIVPVYMPEGYRPSTRACFLATESGTGNGGADIISCGIESDGQVIVKETNSATIYGSVTYPVD